MKKQVLLLFFLFPLVSVAQQRLTVEVQGVKTSNGNINVAVYNKEDGFLKFEKVYFSDSTVALKGQTELKINNLPDGEYALAVFHDENGNNILDTNWLGIPKEPIGFSKGKMKTFGPPTFKECVFLVTSDQEITISL